MEKQEVPGFFQFTQSSRFYALNKDGRTVGNYFTVREGRWVFSFFFVGAYVDDPEIWKELIEPRLQAISSRAAG